MKLNLPQGCIELQKDFQQVILLVAGGRGPSTSWLKQLPPSLPVYAADRGADYCVEAGLKVQRLYGDRDSSTPDKWQQAANHAEVKIFPVAKDATDLDLLLDSLLPGTLVIATGIWGGRADHLYGNILSLLEWQREKNGQIIMADEEEVMVLLTAGEEVGFTSGAKPKAVSLLPFAPKAEVSISGVAWPLDHYAFGSKSAGYTISNVMQAEKCQVNCHAGCLGLYLNFSKGD